MTFIFFRRVAQPPTILCVYIYTYIYIYLSIYPSIHLSIYPSIYPSIYLSIYLSIYTYIYIHIYICVYIYIYTYIYIYIQPFPPPLQLQGLPAGSSSELDTLLRRLTALQRALETGQMPGVRIDGVSWNGFCKKPTIWYLITKQWQ